MKNISKGLLFSNILNVLRGQDLNFQNLCQPWWNKKKWFCLYISCEFKIWIIWEYTSFLNCGWSLQISGEKSGKNQEILSRYLCTHHECAKKMHS